MTHIEKIRALLEERQLVRYADLTNSGIPPFAIKRAISQGVIKRFPDDDYPVGYYLGGRLSHENGDAEQILRVVVRHRKAVVWGISAMKFHELIDRSASAMTTLAVPMGSNRLSTDSMVNISAWSNPKYFQVGIQSLDIFSFHVPITDVWRTVIDAIRIATMDTPGLITTEQADSAVVSAVYHGRHGVKGYEALNRLAKYAVALKYPARVLKHLEAIASFIDHPSPERASGNSKLRRA